MNGELLRVPFIANRARGAIDIFHNRLKKLKEGGRIKIAQGSRLALHT
ncbi:MAG TPA: hypothetical protein VF797_14110 [Noviherbaspirillum sp.]